MFEIWSFGICLELGIWGLVLPYWAAGQLSGSVIAR